MASKSKKLHYKLENTFVVWVKHDVFIGTIYEPMKIYKVKSADFRLGDRVYLSASTGYATRNDTKNTRYVGRAIAMTKYGEAGGYEDTLETEEEIKLSKIMFRRIEVDENLVTRNIFLDRIVPVQELLKDAQIIKLQKRYARTDN